jgi:hypothetical protein
MSNNCMGSNRVKKSIFAQNDVLNSIKSNHTLGDQSIVPTLSIFLVLF